MTELPSPVRYELTRNQILSLPVTGGLTVACERGLVWVTADGRRDDYWLPPGDTLFVSRGGRVVIEAAQASAIAVRRHLTMPHDAWLKNGLERLRNAIASWGRTTAVRRDGAEQLCASERQ
jgi:hypothetical protein